jgi:hypothetical protein
MAFWLRRIWVSFRVPLLATTGLLAAGVVAWWWTEGLPAPVVRFGSWLHDLDWPSARKAGLSAPFFLLALFVFAYYRARHTPRGAVSLGEFVDTTDGPDGLVSQLTAIMRDRLASAGGRRRGIVPSYPGVDLGGENLVSASFTVSSAVLRIALDAWQLLTSRTGWRVNATIRRNRRTGEYGMTFVVERIATGRHELVRTVWARDPQDVARQVAYEIAAWHRTLRAVSSSRSRPRWQPSADALRHYEEAVFYSTRRRFDDAFEAARAGLGADPTHLVLRRVLGETYERFGHYVSALQTYAAGMVLLLDHENGWSRSALDGSDPDHADGRWPRRMGARRRIRSDEAAGLFWRYTVVLTFADQWVDRWVADLELSEHERRSGRSASTISRPPPVTQPLGLPTNGSWPDRPGVIEQLIAAQSEQEWRARFEEARRMRGFFSRRYETLLRNEFPLLYAAWFVESHERSSAFTLNGEPVETGDDHTPAPRPGPASIDDLLRRETIRFPLREPHGRREAGRRDAPGTVRPDQADWLAPIIGLFAFLADQEARPEAGPHPQQTPAAGGEPQTVPQVLLEAHRRLGTRRGDFGRIRHAIADPRYWLQVTAADHPDRLVLDRQLLASVASWAGFQLTRIQRARPELDLPLTLFTTLSAQLDLRTFFHRAALDELDRLRRRQDVASSSLTPAPMRRALRLSARFRYLERLHELRDTPEPVFVGADGRRDEGRLSRTGRPPARWRRAPIDPADRVGLRLDTAIAARKVASWWAVRRMSGGQTGPWNLWYYSACLLSMVMQEPPPMADPDSAAIGLWKRRNDPLADWAIRALNEAILVHRRGDLTAIQAGATDWLLYEDPDLDHLRSHPRFQRWASATFGVAHVDQGASPVDRWQRRRTRMLQNAEWRNEGVFGSTRRWGAGHRLFRLANDHYLVDVLTLTAPLIADRWLDLAITFALAATDDPPENADPADLRALSGLLGAEAEVWSALALYRRFPARPQLRRQFVRALDRLVEVSRPELSFPTSQQVLSGNAALSYDDFDRLLNRLVTGCLADLAAWREAPHSSARRPRPDQAGYARNAHARWNELAVWMAAVRPVLDDDQAVLQV